METAKVAERLASLKKNLNDMKGKEIGKKDDIKITHEEKELTSEDMDEKALNMLKKGFDEEGKTSWICKDCGYRCNDKTRSKRHVKNNHIKKRRKRSNVSSSDVSADGLLMRSNVTTLIDEKIFKTDDTLPENVRKSLHTSVAKIKQNQMGWIKHPKLPEEWQYKTKNGKMEFCDPQGKIFTRIRKDSLLGPDLKRKLQDFKTWKVSDPCPQGWLYKIKNASSPIPQVHFLSPQGNYYQGTKKVVKYLVENKCSSEDLSLMKKFLIKHESWKEDESLPENWLFKGTG